MRQEKRKEQNKAAISLFLCFSVIALASVFTVQSSIDKINEQNERYLASNQPGQPVTKPVPTVDSRDNPAPAKTSSNTEFEVPVKGTVINHFSPDMPIYSKTLDQYMTHIGIDIEAPLDTQVKAIASGTVTDIFNDDMFGTTIEITHEDGLRSIYSNLSVTSMVEIGDVVEKGQVISGIGDTALFESLEVSHLHFEMIKDDKHVNPEDFIIF
ncbi:MAG: M23 family metallopeptidase [Clostridiales bacterium]|nr:M23 family metallopeptidase [Clostridiales bacterium]